MNANVERILLDSSLSDWLKAALRTALECDPVVVANEADVLRSVLMRRVAGDGDVAITASVARAVP